MTDTATPSVAERLAAAVDEARPLPAPAALRAAVESLLARRGGPLRRRARAPTTCGAALDGWEADGGSTAIGHARTLDSAGAAFVNGTAAHGEDFDDTFEGGPVHAGAVDRAGRAGRRGAASHRRAGRPASASRSASR